MYAPFSHGLKTSDKNNEQLYIFHRSSKNQITYTPMYLHSFCFLVPKTRTQAEKFNLQYRNPECIKSMSDKLRYYRYRKSLHQHDVADYAGIDRSTYIRYESGEEEYFPLDKLSLIAELFGIDTELLLDDYHSFLFRGQGDQIRSLRKSMGLTQNEFGKMYNVHGGTVKRWEGDKARIGREVWEKVVGV